jgi:hypothetical protein
MDLESDFGLNDKAHESEETFIEIVVLLCHLYGFLH